MQKSDILLHKPMIITVKKVTVNILKSMTLTCPAWYIRHLIFLIEKMILDAADNFTNQLRIYKPLEGTSRITFDDRLKACGWKKTKMNVSLCSCTTLILIANTILLSCINRCFPTEVKLKDQY